MRKYDLHCRFDLILKERPFKYTIHHKNGVGYNDNTCRVASLSKPFTRGKQKHPYIGPTIFFLSRTGFCVSNFVLIIIIHKILLNVH